MRPDSRILYILVCICLLFHCYIAYKCAGIFPDYSGHFYWFTVPHLALLPISILVVGSNIFIVSKTAVLSAKVCLASSIPTYIFAMLLWPGGDDGPGMAWEFVVGAASLANVAGGIPMVNAAFKLDLEYT